LERRSPNDAGTSNPKPAMSVATTPFEPIFNGYSNFPSRRVYIPAPSRVSAWL
jgi:hypothetical protein